MTDTTSTILIKPVVGLVAPVAVGTVVAAITADPTAPKNLTLAGTDAAKFTLSGTTPNFEIVAAVELLEADYKLNARLAEPVTISVGSGGAP